MISRIFSKPQTQAVIKDLRKAGYTVTKDNSGMYECKLDDIPPFGGGELLFAAMPGHRGYLVRYDARLLTEAR